MGQTSEDVGFGYNKDIITGLLRNTYHFDGIICTDWALVTDGKVFGYTLKPASAHGVENLSAKQRVEKIINAGSVFIGNYSPESVGDYASGTNHTLPTNGYAKAYSGVSVDSFVKKITFQQLTEMGLKNIAQTVIQMASGEQLEAHAQAVAIRVKDIESKM